MKTFTYNSVLDLLKKILPKATQDPTVAGQIYSACAVELTTAAHIESFHAYCQEYPLAGVSKDALQLAYKDFKNIWPDWAFELLPTSDTTVSVTATLPSKQVITTTFEVSSPESEEQEIVLKFVPFPVCLPGDAELVWLLAKRENMTPEEAGVSLTKIEDDFWSSKTGQKLLRDRVERSFPEFISRVPATAFKEHGLKRLFKTPEPIKSLHQ